MATILQSPGAIELSGNIKDFIVDSSVAIPFQVKIGAEVILTESYEPNSDNSVIIRLKDIIPSLLKLNFPTSDVFEQTESVKIFTFVVDGVSSDHTVVKGGVDADITTDSWLKANFLTWQPQQKYVKFTAPEWLSYYAAVACNVKVKAYFKDDDPAPATIVLTALTAGKLYCLNMSYGYLSGLFAGQPVYFDVWVEDAEATVLSFVQRFILSADFYDHDDFFVFESSLGGFDTVRFTGEKEETNSFDIESALFDESTTDFDVDFERVFKKDTGFFADERHRVWANEFFNSLQRYFCADSGYQAITVSKPKAKAVTGELASYSFEFALSKQTKFLNLSRASELPDVVEIVDPADTLFFLAPRLSEFPLALLYDELLLPIQVPFANTWKATSYGAVKNNILAEVALLGYVAGSEVSGSYAKLAGGNSFSGVQTFNNGIVINGDIIQNGDPYETHAEHLNVENNLMQLNVGEPGGQITGVIPGTAIAFSGIEINRGSADPYYMGIVEGANPLIKLGKKDSLVTVMAREDTPTDAYPFVWDDASKRAVTVGSVRDSYRLGGILASGYALLSGAIFTGGVSVGTAINPIVAFQVNSGNPPLWKGGGAFGYTSNNVILGELSGKAQLGGHNSSLNAWADLYINSGGGKVAIGKSTAPIEMLDVNGSIVSSGYVGAETFVSGFTGAGWRIDQNSSLTVDYLTVRKSMNVYELVINKIRGTNGALLVSDTQQVKYVTEDANYWFLWADEILGNIEPNLMPFIVGDEIRCQHWSGNNIKYYEAIIVYVDNTRSVIGIAKAGGIIAGVDVPEAGDVIGRYDSQDTNRKGLLYLTSSDTNAPYMDVIYDRSTKARYGRLDGITSPTFGNLSGYGFWTENGYLEGGINASFGKIGNWNISNRLYSTIGGDGAAGIYLDPNQRNIISFLDSSNNIVYYYNTVGDWGLKGTADAQVKFQLGSTNQIAGILFDDSKLTAGNIRIWKTGVIENTTGAYSFNNDGSGQVAHGNISFDAVGNVEFAPAVALTWLGPIDDIAIGGRNLYKTTTVIYDALGNLGGIWQDFDSDSENGFAVLGSAGQLGVARISQILEGNGEYIMSFWAKSNGNTFALVFDIADNPCTGDNIITGDWKKYELKATVNNYTEVIYHFADFENIPYAWVYVRDFKIERGNKATDWTVALEDVDPNITTITNDTITTTSVIAKSLQVRAANILDTLTASQINFDGATGVDVDLTGVININTKEATGELEAINFLYELAGQSPVSIGSIKTIRRGSLEALQIYADNLDIVSDLLITGAVNVVNAMEVINLTVSGIAYFEQNVNIIGSITNVVNVSSSGSITASNLATTSGDITSANNVIGKGFAGSVYYIFSGLSFSLPSGYSFYICEMTANAILYLPLTADFPDGFEITICTMGNYNVTVSGRTGAQYNRSSTLTYVLDDSTNNIKLVKLGATWFHTSGTR